MKLSLNRFAGMMPAVADHLLPGNAATDCLNATMVGGSIVPVVQSVPNVAYITGGDVRSFRLDSDTMERDLLQDIDARYTQAVADGDVGNPSSLWGFLRPIGDASSRRLLARNDHGTFVKAPLARDLYNRWYSAGDAGTPKLHYELDGAFLERELGVLDMSLDEANRVWSSRDETSIMTLIEYDEDDNVLASVVAEPAPDIAQEVFCSYYITAVSDLGEEGVPSTPSRVFSRFDHVAVSTAQGSEYPYLPDYFPSWSSDNVYRFGAQVNVSISAATYNNESIQTIRLYRAEGGDSGNFVADFDKTEFIANGDGTAYTLPFIDRVASAFLGYEGASNNFNPPDPAMRQIVNVMPGVMAGHFDNIVCFSQPYYPHAWPVEYQYALSSDYGQIEVRGICPLNGGVLVTTNAKPFILYGSEPSSLSQQSVDMVAPNLSSRGLVDMGEFALYPSHEGLVMVSPSGFKVVTSPIYTREQWKALKPETFVAFRYRDEYLCFHEGGAFSFDLQHGVFPIQVDIDGSGTTYEYVQDGYYSPTLDVFWLLIKSSPTSTSSQIVSFQYNPANDRAEMVWQSKEITMPANGVLTCARIDGDGSVEFTIEEPGGSYSFSTIARDERGFRLPPGRPRSVRIRMRSNHRINTITLASQMSELK